MSWKTIETHLVFKKKIKPVHLLINKIMFIMMWELQEIDVMVTVNHHLC